MTDHRVMCGRLLPAIQVGMKSWSWKKAGVAIVIGASLAANAGFGLCNAKLMKPEAPPSSWPDTSGRCRRPPLLLRKYTLKAKRGKQVGAVKTLLACCTLPLVLFPSRPPLLHLEKEKAFVPFTRAATQEKKKEKALLQRRVGVCHSRKTITSFFLLLLTSCLPPRARTSIGYPRQREKVAASVCGREGVRKAVRERPATTCEMATPPEQTPDAVASTTTATGETDDETDDETINETDNELLSAYVDVSSDYESDNDETNKVSLAAMKFARSTPAFHAKSTDIATANAHFSALKLYVALDSSSKTNPWQPNVCEYEETTPMCRMRVKCNIADLLTDPPPGVHVVPAEHNITVMDALVLGPDGTPYEGGFFHFVIQCPPGYPIKPPRVRLMTTGYGGVRFNPNLYECGMVCLSILGTWTGPAWSPAQSIASVLISIQSLLSENPYHNEPDYETDGSSTCPPPLREVMLKTFPDYYDKYEAVVVSNEDLTGRFMEDPFGANRGQFQYKTLLKRLQALKGRVQEWLKARRERRE
ncbi:hypothetical protein MRX96_023241 [Rhipicephalus microplus]